MDRRDKVGALLRPPWNLAAVEWKLGLLTFLATFFDVGIGCFRLCGYAISPFRILIALLFAVFLTRLAFDSREWHLPRPASFIILFLVFWGAYGALSLTWAANLDAAIHVYTFLGLGLATALVFALALRGRAALALIPRVWIIGMACLVAVGAWERITGNHLPISAYNGTRDILYRYTPTGFFPEPNVYSTVVALGFPFLFCAAIAAKRWLPRLALLLPTAAVPWVIFATGSRANIIALGLEIAALLVCVIRPLRSWRVCLALLVLLGSFQLAFPEVLPGMFQARHAPTVTAGEQQPESTMVRWEVIKRGVTLLLDSHGAGVGPGGFEYAMRAVQDRKFGGIRDMHNWWAQVLVEYGVLVFGGYLLVLIALLWSLLMAARKASDERMRSLGAALFCSLVGFFFASISPSSIIDLPAHWAFLGVCIAYVAATRSKESELCTS